MAGKLPVKVSIVSGNTPLKNVLKLFDAGALVSSVVAHAADKLSRFHWLVTQCVRVGTYHVTVDVSTRTYVQHMTPRLLLHLVG